jgi:hypothetical protein
VTLWKEAVAFPVAALRLRNIAKEKRTNSELLLRRYAIERLLYRLSLSPHRDRFILKGAMLFAVWLDDPFRPTQDLDLLGFGANELPALAKAFREICRQEVDDDGLVFDVDNLVAEPIREDQDYGGVHIRTVAQLGRTRIPVQVDIGFGDAITPSPDEIQFPPLLDTPAPILKAYPKETVVAEKFQAIVMLGLANSRMKDYYDLTVLSRLFVFDGPTLSSAIKATFERRDTPLPSEMPVGLSDAFAQDSLKTAQWQAFKNREPLALSVGDLLSIVSTIRAFVIPPTLAATTVTPFEKEWSPEGVWRTG